MRKLTPADWDADEAEIRRRFAADPGMLESVLAMNRRAREQAEALGRAAKLSPGARAGKVGAVTEHIIKVMDDNPGVTKPAKVIALLDRKITKGMSPDTLRKAVLRAKTNRGLSHS